MNKYFKKIKNIKGFSLIEIIIYLALLIIVSVLVIQNLISLFKNYNVVKTNQEIEYNAINIIDKISRDVKSSKNVIVNESIFSIPQGAVSLNTASGTVKYYLEENKIKYMKNGFYFSNLSTKNIIVDNFKLYYINATNTEAIRLELGLRSKAHLNSDFINKNFYTTIQLRE